MTNKIKESPKASRSPEEAQIERDRALYGQLTCERCGNKTDGGAWIGFVYVGAECLTTEDKEYLE